MKANDKYVSFNSDPHELYILARMMFDPFCNHVSTAKLPEQLRSKYKLH